MDLGGCEPRDGFLSNTICLAATRCSRTWLDWEKEKPLRVLEALGSTGIRSRRWRKEISAQYQNRFKICVNDRNIKAIEQGQNAADFFEKENEIYPYFDEIEGANKAGITWSNQDANQLMFEQNFQWIGLRPIWQSCFFSIFCDSIITKGWVFGSHCYRYRSTVWQFPLLSKVEKIRQ